MHLLRFIRQESRLAERKLLVMASLSGLSNALILAIINKAAEQAADNLANFRYLVLFAVTLTLYIITQRFILIESTREIEQILHQIRIRLADKIRRSQLLPLERLGRGDIYASVSKETTTISQAAATLVIACQSALLILFTTLYLAWLSRAAFLLTLLVAAVAVTIHLSKAGRLQKEIHAALVHENHYFDILTHMLDGFKEIKMNRARSQALFRTLEDISAQVARLKTLTQTQFALHFIFSQVSFYFLLGALVFVLPRFSQTYPEVLTKATAAILFITGPILSLVGAIPVFANASAAVDNIYALEASLDAADGDPADDGPVRTLPGFQELRLAGMRFTYRDVDGLPTFTVGPVELRVEAGEMLFIVGGNGSGKSTFLMLLTGLFQPDEGRLELDGQPVTGGTYGAYRELFSTIFSDYHLFDRLYGIDGPEERGATELLEDFGLTAKTRLDGDRFTNLELSSGQKKRLALVITHLEDRPICVFDEWAADQDPGFRHRFYHELLPRLKATGKTVIAVTHDDKYFHLADRVVKMTDGRLEEFSGGLWT